MRTPNFLVALSTGLLVATLISCDQQTPPPEEIDDPVAVEADPVEEPTYDPSEGLHRLAPEMLTMIQDTLGIVMYEAVMEPGDSVGWHEHPVHTVYVLQGGTLAVYFEGMERQVLELPTGLALIQPALGDAAVNIGDTPVRLLTHDLYSLAPER
ncbi:hypothetical protein [Lewinella sp. JB7]|uniref:hypothetical protein n=1 Tax=Lewinella sp. JB7 TaxID=2962887 RepID=UPI0020C94452|nr:hypothetical protein [Lewinella sp. JB7]MCP9236305.1 hypothetical protein [Lewinella sp. JB7]